MSVTEREKEKKRKEKEKEGKHKAYQHGARRNPDKLSIGLFFLFTLFLFAHPL
jgi:hypothetical protein